MFYGYYFSTVFGWFWNTTDKPSEASSGKKDDEGTEPITSISSEADNESTASTALNEAIIASINDPPPAPLLKPLASPPIQVVCKKKQQKWNKHHIH